MDKSFHSIIFPFIPMQIRFPFSSYFRLSVYLFSTWALMNCSAPAPSRESASPDGPFKHVVVIIGDDHASTVLGAYGNSLIHTPNLDRLAAKGTLFTNAYANSPLCSASRQSLLTGTYPHTTGVNLLFTPFNDATNTTIAEELKAEGYATALIGKQHFNTWIWGSLYEGGYPTFGFDTLIDKPQHRQWLETHPPTPIPDDVATFSRQLAGVPDYIAQVNPHVLPSATYDKDAEGTFLAESAIRFMEANKEDPFFLWLAFHEPHAPFAFPIEYAGSYAPEEVPLPEGGPEDDLWVPERFKGFSEREKRGVIASYYTSVEYLDKNVGLVLDALEEKGLMEETLIIYLGDQGYLLNEHKRFEKHTMWKESIKAPLIVAGGNTLPKGVIREELIEFVDVMPTIEQALGLEISDKVQGKSFYPLLTGDEYESREYVFAEFLEDNKAMVANKEWKYIFTTGKRDLGQGYATGNGPFGIVHRLYQLSEDPNETTNVAEFAEHQDVLLHMKRLMLQHFLDTHPDADRLPDYLTLDGKLVWFCEPRDVGAEYGGEPLRTFYED